MTLDSLPNTNPLRAQAERLIDQRQSQASDLSPDEVRRLIHELQVHQIELEIQNEELRRTLDQLELSRQRSFTLFDQAPVGYLVLNEVGMVRQVNLTFCNMVNRTRDSILNHPISDLIETPEREVFLARFRAFFRNPVGKSLEARFLRADGQDLVARLQGSSITNLEGTQAESAVVQLLLTASDITELKRADKALQRSEERYRRLTENAQDIIYRYELLPTPHFSYVSPAATMMTGYTPEEHYADPQLGYKLVHPDDLHLLNAAAHPGQKMQETLVMRWVRKDGQTIWTEQRNVPILDENGGVVALEGIARDITQRKHDEDALRASLQENKVLYRELQHRTKNSMAMIASLVSLETTNATDGVVIKALTNVRDRIRTLSDLYRLLFLSGDLQVVRLDVYFNEVIESLKYAYGGRVGYANTAVDLAEVIADEKTASALGLIVNELVTNALKYAFPNGREGVIRVSLQNTDDRLILQVEDNGVGLDDSFDIAEAEGIGMQLVSMLTSQVKGTLTYTRRAPTRFSINLPLPRKP